MKKPFILIDGSSYFFRAFHALPPLMNSKGQHTGAVYGVANMIKRLIKDYQPTQMAVIFDAAGKTFRDELYPAYKAHRAPMPEDLRNQFKPLLNLLQTMGLPILIIDGVEADDVIGTLTHAAIAQGQSVLISTGDKDMAQLVCEGVTLINTMSNQQLDIAGVREKFGVNPSQMIDYLALVGDSSDNIPGVPKCGPKTAAKWLQDHQSLEQLLEHADTITGKIGENLRASKSHLPLSKQLATIRTDVQLPMTIEELTIKPIVSEQLIALVSELEFKTWLKDLLTQQEQNTSEEPACTPAHIEIIVEDASLKNCLSQLQNCTTISFCTIGSKQDVMACDLLAIAFTITQDHSIYIPFFQKNNAPYLSCEMVLSTLKPILESSTILKIGHNLKNDYLRLKHYGIHLQGLAYDTMLESYVLNSTVARHDLESLALGYLGCKMTSYSQIAGVGIKQLPFNEIPIEKAAAYVAEHTEVPFRLHKTLYTQLDANLAKVFQNIEIPLLTVLAEIEYNGVLIDEALLRKHGERLKAYIQQLEIEAVQLAGRSFNLNSPKQLQEVLFDELKLPILTKTPTGQASTAESVLQELAYDYRLPAVILEYRSLSKLVSTYIDALPKRVNAKTVRVHTSYNQAVTATGRLSSSDPNLQNIPIRSEEGRLIRKAFIAPAHHNILAADYSQIELRIMAHLSQDPNLLYAFTHDLDVHAATASEIFGVALEEVNNEHRRRAKVVNFGLMYGMSSFGLAKELGVERSDAQHYIDRYFQRYPGVLEYMEKTRHQARTQGFVETVFGRRLYVPDIRVSNKLRQKAAERMAINAPLQGTAADIIKKAMISIFNWQKQHHDFTFKMIMQVHDELVFEVPEKTLPSVQDIVVTSMQNAAELSVPLLVSAGVGKNWDEAH